MTRQALQDFSFSDGTFVPAGTLVSTPQMALHTDGSVYENPGVFNPWRFADMREPEGEGTKHSMVSTSVEYVAFGHGRHAWCVPSSSPPRLAVYEMGRCNL